MYWERTIMMANKSTGVYLKCYFWHKVQTSSGTWLRSLFCCKTKLKRYSIGSSILVSILVTLKGILQVFKFYQLSGEMNDSFVIKLLQLCDVVFVGMCRRRFVGRSIKDPCIISSRNPPTHNLEISHLHLLQVEIVLYFLSYCNYGIKRKSTMWARKVSRKLYYTN